MSSDIDTNELIKELETYGEVGLKITDKNKAIYIKKLNHFRAREAMAAKEILDQKRRSAGRSPNRVSIGRTYMESNGVNLNTEERKLRRRTIATSTDQPSRDQPIKTERFESKTPSIHSQPILYPSLDENPSVNFRHDKYLSSTPVVEKPNQTRRKVGMRPAWDASDSEGEAISSSIKTDKNFYRNFGEKSTGSNGTNFVNKESAWQQKKSIIVSSRMILFAVVCVFVLIAIFYLFKITNTKTLLIEGDEKGSGLLEEVLAEIKRRNGRIVCQNEDLTKMWLPLDQVKRIINQASGSSADTNTVLENMKKFKSNHLSFADLEYNIVSGDQNFAYLKLNEFILTLPCRIHRALVAITWKIALIILGIFMLLGMSVAVWLLRQRHQRQQRDVLNLANEIIGLVRNNDELARRDSSINSYVAMMQVRDSLIPANQRNSSKDVWNKALFWVLENEPRLKPCRELIDNKLVDAWKWDENARPSYATSNSDALNLKEARVVLPRYEPKFDTGDFKVAQSCIKIYNLLASDALELDAELRDALLDRCGLYHGILHIGIDSVMEKGVIFVRCISDSAAGQNYKFLHGWNYKGRLVSVRYFSPTAYRMMFPDSDDSMLPLKSTNQAKRRLSGSRNN